MRNRGKVSNENPSIIAHERECKSKGNDVFVYSRIVSLYFQPFHSLIVINSPRDTWLSAMISFLPSACPLPLSVESGRNYRIHPTDSRFKRA